MQDKLDQIFDLQKHFQDELSAKRNLKHITAEEWIQKESLAMIDEIGELINETNFKWWKNPKIVDKAAIKEELIDILHFLVSMCLRVDMTAQEMLEIYTAKNKENHNRQNGTSEKEGYATIIK